MENADGIFKPTKLMLMVMGVLSVKFIKQRYHYGYKLIFWFHVICLCNSVILNAVSVYVQHQKRNWSGLFENLSFVLVIGDGLFKMTTLRGSFLDKMWIQIESYEKTIRGNAESYAIYKKFSTFLRKSIIVYVSGSATTVVFYWVKPFFTTIQRIDGTLGRSLILTYWHPIDSAKHYAVAYTTEMFMTCCIFHCVIYPDVLICTQFVFCIIELKILQHRLKNVIRCSSNVARERNMLLSVAQLITIKQIAISHQNVIEMVKHIDKTWRSYFLFQFVLSSFRVCLMIVNVMWRDLDKVEVFTICLYVTALSLQICVYYGLGNEITLQSSDGIYKAVALSNYGELSPAARKMLTIILVGAKTPLTLSIGSFGQVSLDTLIKIMKTGYYLLSALNFFQTEKQIN